MSHFKELCSYVEHFTQAPAIIKIKHDATYIDPLLLPAVEEYIREVKNSHCRSCPFWELDDYFLTEQEVIDKRHELARRENERTRDEYMKDWMRNVKKVVCVPSTCGWYFIPV